jgi:predicted nucleotidyltransferase
MNVAGFEEALASSVLIEIEAKLAVHVASVAGLTLLKLAAWMDRGRECNKDAADLYRLLTSYADAGNTDRLQSLQFLRGGRGQAVGIVTPTLLSPELAFSDPL